MRSQRSSSGRGVGVGGVVVETLPPLMRKGKGDSVLRAGFNIRALQRWMQAQEPKAWRSKHPDSLSPAPSLSSLHWPNHLDARRRSVLKTVSLWASQGTEQDRETMSGWRALEVAWGTDLGLGVCPRLGSLAAEPEMEVWNHVTC